mmetsp:Transcript_19191/g.23770  ORF Transcript_19191/g.23770 Transcript_19191/m.23770 type:complete len:152 (-) Transcript_19191:32-487(-)
MHSLTPSPHLTAVIFTPIIVSSNITLHIRKTADRTHPKMTLLQRRKPTSTPSFRPHTSLLHHNPDSQPFILKPLSNTISSSLTPNSSRPIKKSEDYLESSRELKTTDVTQMINGLSILSQSRLKFKEEMRKLYQQLPLGSIPVNTLIKTQP